MDRRAWWATVHRVENSQTRLSDQHYYHDIKEKRKLGEGKMKVYQLDESRGKSEVRHTIILFFNTAEIPINDEVPALMAE